MPQSVPFKQCPMCSKVWLTRQDFVCDPCLSIDGYQLDHENIDHGLLLFTHRVEGCGGSMALLSLDFFDLIFSYDAEKTAAIEGPVPSKL